MGREGPDRAVLVGVQVYWSQVQIQIQISGSGRKAFGLEEVWAPPFGWRSDHSTES